MAHNDGSSLLGKLREIREKDNSASIVVTGVVKGYVAKGMRTEKALNILKDNGFDIHEVPRDKGGVVYVAVSPLNGKSFFGFYDEVKVVVYTDGDVVAGLSAKIIYRGL